MDAPLPDPRRTVADSAWVAERDGLPAAAAAWQRELAPVRADLDREARAIAEPRLWVDTVGSLATTGWRVAAAAAPDAPRALLGLVADRLERAANARTDAPTARRAGARTTPAAGHGAAQTTPTAGHGAARTTPADYAAATGTDPGAGAAATATALVPADPPAPEPRDPVALLLTAAAAAFGMQIGPRRDAGGLRAVEQLVRAGGPAYVKLGQFVASAEGLLPAEWVEAFAWCRDRVPPVKSHVAMNVLARELGPDLGGLVDVDPEPFAAASIGQVHRAKLADGTPVVVKIRRPGLRKRFVADIESLAIVAAGLHRWQPAARVANLPGFVGLFAHLSLQELDLRLEALNMVECGAAFDAFDGEGCSFPRPIPGLVTERVLVMEEVPGVSADRAAAEYGDALDGEALLHLAVRGVIEGTLVHGLFHGDMHAGNVLVDGGDRFSLVDFGICGRLTPRERAGLVQFLVAFATMDAAKQVKALDRFGALPPEADHAKIAAALQAQLDALPADGVAFDALGEHLGGVLRLFAREGFELPPELVLFFKNVLYLSALAANVAPDADLLSLLAPTMGHFGERYGAEFAAMAAD